MAKRVYSGVLTKAGVHMANPRENVYLAGFGAIYERR